jgi:hypothetical protein
MTTQTSIDLKSIAGKCLRIIAAVGLAGLLAACGGKDSDDGEFLGSVPLPTDSALKLYCPDAGIADEPCILDDPDNPYALTMVNNDNKFDLFNLTPSAKAGFYLWATAQAMGPSGENQFYTAAALKAMWEESDSELARDQALRAYRSVLDNYYDSLTFLECAGDSCPIAGTYAQPLRSYIWNSLQSFFDNDAETIREYIWEEWGYLYEPYNPADLNAGGEFIKGVYQ